MTTAGVTAGITTSVTTGVTVIALVVLRDLDSLLQMFQLDSNDPVLVLRRSVDWSWCSVVGRDSVTVTAGLVGLLVGLVLDFVFQDDVLDLLK